MAKGRKTGGRRPGSHNKATPIKLAAQAYTAEALAVLVSIMQDPASGAPARVSAAREILDRGYGKPAQALTDAEGGPLIPAKVVHQHITG